MINYLKLHFSFIFSKVFIVIYLLILTILFLGIYYSAGLDLSYSYVDGFKHSYYLEYLNQSSLLMEIIICLLGIFIGVLLSSKTNDFLIRFTVNDYKQKMIFLICRYIIGILIIFSTLYISVIFFIITGHYLTPFSLDLGIIFDIAEIILLETLSLYFILSFLMSILNHFLIGIVPLLVFWYKKTIYDFHDLTSEIDVLILKLIPSFLINNEKVVIYQNLTYYIIILIAIISFSLIINLLKDCG